MPGSRLWQTERKTALVPSSQHDVRRSREVAIQHLDAVYRVGPLPHLTVVDKQVFSHTPLRSAALRDDSHRHRGCHPNRMAAAAPLPAPADCQCINHCTRPDWRGCGAAALSMLPDERAESRGICCLHRGGDALGRLNGAGSSRPFWVIARTWAAWPCLASASGSAGAGTCATTNPASRKSEPARCHRPGETRWANGTPQSP